MSNSYITEELVFFPCGDISLAGILAAPVHPNGLGVLTTWGSGKVPSSAKNRVRARLARTLAERGFHAFRFDDIGVGESEGRHRPADLAKPGTKEILAASAFLRSRGLERQVVIAHCFGGWSTLIAAPEIDGLEGVVVLNTPVWRDHDQVQFGEGDLRWWMSRLREVKWKSELMQADRWTRFRKLLAAKAKSLAISPRAGANRFSQAVGYLIDNHIPLLLMYGTDDFRSDLERELQRGLRGRLEEAGPPTCLVSVLEPLQGFASLDAQNLLIETVVPWLDQLLLAVRPRD